MIKQDQVILITGGSSGIGQAAAELLAEHGMRCLLVGRNEKRLQELTGVIPNSSYFAGDMTDPVLPEKLIDYAVDRFGRLDAVFNNAGVMNIGSVDDADIEALCYMIRLNFEALVRMSYVAVRYFKKQGSGFLINTSSLAGLKTIPKVGVYNGTKFAVEAFTDSLRMELAGSGVRVAVIEPGRTRTHLFDHWGSDQQFNPEEGFLDPADVARSVKFILDQPGEVLVSRLLVVPSKQPR